MAAVALELFRAELAVPLQRKSRILPTRDSAGHGRHVVVAHGAQHLSRQQRTGAARTINDHFLVGLRYLAAHLKLEKAARDGNRAVNITGTHLIVLAHVKEHEVVTGLTALLHLLYADLRYFLPRRDKKILLRLSHT